MTFAARAVGAAIGYSIDRVLGEPPDHFHPMIGVGHGLTRSESALYADDRLHGVIHLAGAVGAAAVTGRVLQSTLGTAGSTAITVALCSSSKMLGSTALDVARALRTEGLDAGRHQLRSLVGRDPSALDEIEISRAVVESVAENTVDAVTATLFWALVVGPQAVLVHRVTNTLDAMVGHRNDRYRNFGWASARLDDALNWLPARLTAGAIAISAPVDAGDVLSIVKRDGAKHPSPNGGRVEAAVAGALGVTLGGSNDYGGRVEVRGPLGNGRLPQPSDIAPAVVVTRRASDLIALVGLGIATSIAVARRWRR